MLGPSLTSRPATVFATPEEATAAARAICEGDDWTFILVSDPAGSTKTLVDLFDEEGKIFARI